MSFIILILGDLSLIFSEINIGDTFSEKLIISINKFLSE